MAKTDKEHFDDFFADWFPSIVKSAKRSIHKIPSGSSMTEDDLTSIGVYALHHAIKHFDPKKHPGGFVAYTKSTINGQIQQALKDNQPVDSYFYDKYINPHIKSKTKVSEVKDIPVDQAQPEQPQVSEPEVEPIKPETTEKLD